MSRILASPIFNSLNNPPSAANQALQLDACVSNFSRQAADFQMIGSFALAGMFGQFSSQAFLSAGLVRNPLIRHFLSQTVSIGAEAAALTGFQAPSLLEQNSSLAQTFRGHALNLTALRISAALFHRNFGLLQHFSASFGMMAGHRLAMALHWEEKTSRSLAEEFFEAEFINLQMQAGHLLGRNLGGQTLASLQQHSARQSEYLHSPSHISHGILGMAHNAIVSPKRVKYHSNFIAGWETMPLHIKTRVLRVIEAIADANLRSGANLKKMGGIQLRQVKLSLQYRLLFMPRGKNFEMIHVGTHNETDRVIRQWYLTPLEESSGSNGFNPFKIRESGITSVEELGSDGTSVHNHDASEAAYDRYWRNYEAAQSTPEAFEISIEDACPALKDPREVLEGVLSPEILKKFPELSLPGDEEIVALSENSLWRGNSDSRLILHLQALRARLGKAPVRESTRHALNDMDEYFSLMIEKDDPLSMAEVPFEIYAALHPTERLRVQPELPHFANLSPSALHIEMLIDVTQRKLLGQDFDVFMERCAASDPFAALATWMIDSPRKILLLGRRPSLNRSEIYTKLFQAFPLCEFSSDAPLLPEEWFAWTHPEKNYHEEVEGIHVEGLVEHYREVYGQMQLALDQHFPSGSRSENGEGFTPRELGSAEDMLAFWNQASGNFRRTMRHYQTLLGDATTQTKLSRILQHLTRLKRLGLPENALEAHALQLFEHAAFADSRVLEDGFENFPGVTDWLERCPEVMAEEIARQMPQRETTDLRRFHTQRNRSFGAALFRMLRHPEFNQKITDALWRRTPEAELSNEQMLAWLHDIHCFVARAYVRDRSSFQGQLPLGVEGNPCLDLEVAETQLVQSPLDFPEGHLFSPADIIDRINTNRLTLHQLDPDEGLTLMETVLANGSCSARVLTEETVAIYRAQEPFAPFIIDDETCMIGNKTTYRPFNVTYRWGLLLETFLLPEVLRLANISRRFDTPSRERFMQTVNRAANLLVAGAPIAWSVIAFYRRFMREYCDSRTNMLKSIEAQFPDFPLSILNNLPLNDLFGMEMQVRIMMDEGLSQHPDLKLELANLKKAYMRLSQNSTGEATNDEPYKREVATQFGRFILRHHRILVDFLGVPRGVRNTFSSLLDRINEQNTPELTRDSPSFQRVFTQVSPPRGVSSDGNFAHYYMRAIALIGLVSDRLPLADRFIHEELAPLARQNGAGVVLTALEFYLAHRQEILAFVPANLQ